MVIFVTTMRPGFTFIFLLLLFNCCQNHESVQETVIGKANRPAPDMQLAKMEKTGTAGKRFFSHPEKTKSKVKSSQRKNHIIKSLDQADSTLRHKAYTSLLIERLSSIRSQGIIPDMNEPITRRNLFSQTDNKPFESMIELSREMFLQINFDNDILDYTDRFYTNGIKIDLIAPGLQMNPISRLMTPYWRSGINYYGLSLVQNMFTPSTTKTGGILFGDRPYSAYLFLGCFKITNDRLRKLRQTSELDLGIIGPGSYGEWVQRSFHNSVPSNNEPLGWEYQVKNDLVLNYSLGFEKGILSAKNYDMQLTAKGNLGTLYTNISGGFLFRTGWMNPYFSNLGISKKRQTVQSGLKKFQCYFFVKGSGQLVGYDATLQGGFFNKSSVYTIPSKDVSRFVFKGSAGITISNNGFGLDIEQFFLSPEYHQGLWHKWVHIALRFAL
ncbi:MAG: lipid A deacylase LpxR family protein [Bacteroidetes bacterium]|nr:lipid A deacylase LpxR family protein [Bacteroidota bacterium]